MFKRKLVLFIMLVFVFAFITGKGGGGILTDMFGFDAAPALYAADGCDAGGGC